MYFVNMINDEVISRKKGCPLEITVEDSPAKASCIFKDGKLQINTGSSENDLFTIKGEYKDSDEYNPTGRILGKKEIPVYYKDVKDTEENPLITVLCSVIRVYENVPTGIKFLYINDSQVLACLLYGVADFDGVTMQRGVVENISTENKASKTLTGSDFKYLVDAKDEDTHYEYIADMVVQVELLFKNTSQGTSFSSRKFKDNVIFDMSGIERAREKKRLAEERRAEMERQKAEEDAKRRAEAEERYKNSSLAKEIERNLQEEREKKAKKAEKKSTGKQKGFTGEVTGDPTVQNASAAAFLRIFQSKK